MPYASYFSEDLWRDKEIKELNKKNKLDDYKSFCNQNLINILDTMRDNEFFFEDMKLTKKLQKKIKFLRIKVQLNI